MSTPNDSIFVHRLLPASDLAQQTQALGKILLGASPTGTGDVQFYISPISGCLLYLDRKVLRNRDPFASLPTATAAEEIAVRLCLGVNQSLGRAPLGALRQLFPTDLRHVITVPVYAGPGGAIDHWLVRFLAFLDTGAGPRQPTITKPVPPQLPVVAPIPALVLDRTANRPPAQVSIPATAPVDGGVVEFRIGGGGKLIGLNSRWRPPIESILTRMLAPPAEAKNQAVLQLVYLLGGDEEPLEFIAPFYRAPGDDPDTGRFFPASDRSLAVDFSREDGDNTVSITAVVSGAAGSPRFSWGAWRIDLGSSSGFENLGTGDSVTLSQGVYNVVVDVEDTVTGAFARQQTLVYCGPRPSVPVGK